MFKFYKSFKKIVQLNIEIVIIKLTIPHYGRIQTNYITTSIENNDSSVNKNSGMNQQKNKVIGMFDDEHE